MTKAKTGAKYVDPADALIEPPAPLPEYDYYEVHCLRSHGNRWRLESMPFPSADEAQGYINSLGEEAKCARVIGRRYG